MKKFVLGLFFLIIYSNLFSQDLSFYQKTVIIRKIDTVLRNYSNYADLREPGQNNITDQAVHNFSKLFTQDANIFNSIYPAFLYSDTATLSTAYNLMNQSVADYIQACKTYYPSGLSVKIRDYNIDYATVKDKKIDIYIDEFISGQTSNGYSIQNEDTILMTLKGTGELMNSLLLIASITKIKYNLQVNPKPKLLKEPKPVKSIQHNPPLLGPPVWVSISLGVNYDNMLSSSFNGITQPQKLFYNTTSNNSLTTTFSNSPIKKPSFISPLLGVDLTYFPSRGQKFGISLGLYGQYETSISDLSLQPFTYQYNSSTLLDPYNNHFQQIILLSTPFNEKISSLSIMIPITLSYDIPMNKENNSGIRLGIAGSYNVMLSISSTSSSKIDYGAVYSYNGSKFEASTSNNSTNWIIDTTTGTESASHINQLNSDGLTNVGWDKSVTGSVNKFSSGYTLFFLPAYYIKTSKSKEWMLGIAMRYSSWGNSNSSNYVLTNNVGSYNSVLNATKNINIFSFGINISYEFGLK